MNRSEPHLIEFAALILAIATMAWLAAIYGG